MFVKKLLRLARHLEQKPSTPKGFAHAAGIADFVRCLRNAAAELECADWSSSSTFVIRDARSEVRAGSRAYGGTIMQHEILSSLRKFHVVALVSAPRALLSAWCT